MNLNKRISQLEELNAPKKELPTAWIAEIKDDGKIELSHIKHETIHLPDVNALNNWERQKEGLPVIRIEYVTPKEYEFE